MFDDDDFLKMIRSITAEKRAELLAAVAEVDAKADAAARAAPLGTTGKFRVPKIDNAVRDAMALRRYGQEQQQGSLRHGTRFTGARSNRQPPSSSRDELGTATIVTRSNYRRGLTIQWT